MKTETMPEVPEIERLSSYNAEQRVIGAVLLDWYEYENVSPFLKATDFFFLKHEHIWSAIERRYADRAPVDVESIADELRSVRHLEAIGGLAYLMELANSVPTGLFAVYHAKIVKATAVRRQIAMYADVLKANALDESLSVETVLVRAKGDLEALTQTPTGIAKTVTLDTMLEAHNDFVDEVAMRREDVRRCVPRLPEIARYVPEYEAGGVYLIAARPKTGKSSYGWVEMLHIARTFGPVQGFSLEMSHKQLSTTLLSNVSGVPATALWEGKLTQQQYKSMIEARELLGSAPLHIDTTTFFIEDIWTQVMGTPGLAAVFIDGGNLVRTRARGKDKTYETATHVSRELQRLAKASGVRMFVAMQINREGTERPTMRHLKDTGAWEEDASVVMALHREESPDVVSLDTLIETEVMILANRDGAAGSAMLGWRPAYRAYVSLATNHQQKRGAK